MPSKNKTAAKRRKFQRSRSQRSRSRRRTRTIRGGMALVNWIRSRNRVVPAPDPNPSVNPPDPRSSQPRLPTNVRVVTDPLREKVSKEKRDRINDLTKLKELLVKQNHELVVKKEMFEERLKQEKSIENRRQIREKIAQIRMEIRPIETEIRSTSREIERTQAKDREYREKYDLPPLPADDSLDPATEMKDLDEGAGVYGVHLDKKAVGAELELQVADRNQADLIKAMSEMSVHRDSTPRSGSPARGSLARDTPLPPSGLPSVHRRVRGSRRSPSP